MASCRETDSRWIPSDVPESDDKPSSMEKEKPCGRSTASREDGNWDPRGWRGEKLMLCSNERRDEEEKS